MATINFSKKYASSIAKVFTTSSLVQPNTNGNLDFEGAKTVKVYKLNTMDEQDYQRNGTNRYGDPKDIGDSVYEYTMSQDKSFTGVVDKGDESDQAITNKAGQWLGQQLKEKTTPAADKYALKKICKYGTVAGVAAPTKTTIIEMLADAQVAMDDASVPDSGRITFVPASAVKLIMLSSEFISVDKLGEESLTKGTVGEACGFRIIKVPGSYLPANCYFIALHKSAVAMPYKISEAKVNTDPQGISGALIEGRHYYDVFVLGEKATAVYSAVLSSAVQATPTITIASNTATVTSTGAADIRYTVDGSDPRFSESAASYPSGGVPLTAGQNIRAIAFGADGKFTSAIAQATNAA